MLIHFFAMQVTTEVAWNTTDFLVMGSLLFGMSSLFVLATRKLPSRYQLFAGGMFIAVFLYIWAEPAASAFTSLGN